MCSTSKQRDREQKERNGEKEENSIRVTLGASFTCVGNFSIHMKLLNVRIFFLSFPDFSKDVSSCYTLVFSFLSYIYMRWAKSEFRQIPNLTEFGFRPQHTHTCIRTYTYMYVFVRSFVLSSLFLLLFFSLFSRFSLLFGVDILNKPKSLSYKLQNL